MGNRVARRQGVVGWQTPTAVTFWPLGTLLLFCLLLLWLVIKASYGYRSIQQLYFPYFLK